MLTFNQPRLILFREVKQHHMHGIGTKYETFKLVAILSENIRTNQANDDGESSDFSVQETLFTDF